MSWNDKPLPEFLYSGSKKLYPLYGYDHIEGKKVCKQYKLYHKVYSYSKDGVQLKRLYTEKEDLRDFILKQTTTSNPSETKEVFMIDIFSILDEEKATEFKKFVFKKISKQFHNHCKTHHYLQVVRYFIEHYNHNNYYKFLELINKDNEYLFNRFSDDIISDFFSNPYINLEDVLRNPNFEIKTFKQFQILLLQELMEAYIDEIVNEYLGGLLDENQD